MLIMFANNLRNWNRNIPQIVYFQTKHGDSLTEIRNAESRGAHIDASASRSEVKRRSNDVDDCIHRILPIKMYLLAESETMLTMQKIKNATDFTDYSYQLSAN
jgi:hypothetical protein